MTKKNRTVYLTLGIVVGLFLTACAGVVSGKIDVLDNTNAFTFSPSVQIVQVPQIQMDTVNLVPVAYERANLMAIHQAALQEPALLQAATHLCNRP